MLKVEGSVCEFPVRHLTHCEPMSLDYEGPVSVFLSGSGLFMVRFVDHLVDAKSC